MPVEVGQIVEGKITGITKFGAFVEISEGVTGLIHISEVADTFVKDVNDYLSVNETVKVKVIGVSNDGKISLSIRKLKGNSGDRRNSDRRAKEDAMSFEDKLAKFMKDSEERLLDIKRHHESKRGSGGYGKRRVL